MADRAVVFYSWQSDLPNAVNRGFIQEALERAAKAIRNDDTINIEPVVERDTQNVPGSPQIADTIFQKIAESDVFVADVSFIANGKAGKKKRACPNPNVLVELGFAAHALGWDRIVLVMNTHFGPVEALPFDLKMRRTLGYAASPDEAEKAPMRRALESRLEVALREVLQAPSRVSSPSSLQVAVDGIEHARTDQAASVRDFMRDYTNRLAASAPSFAADVPRDESLIAGLIGSIPIVADFCRLSEALSRHGARDATLALAPGFAELLQQYDFPPRQGGSCVKTDYDFFKFVGHESYVVLVAALMRHERWDLLAELLEEPLTIDTNSGQSNERFCGLASFVTLLRDRDTRLHLNRLCLHGDLLRERYSSEPLATLCPFDQFMEADWFLFLRTDLIGAQSAVANWEYDLWRPWSCVHAERHAVPRFLARMQQRRVAERQLPAFGISDIELFRERYRERAAGLGHVFRSGNFRCPVMDAATIASR